MTLRDFRKTLPEGKIPAPAVPQTFTAGKIAAPAIPQGFTAGKAALRDMRKNLKENKYA
jgi:hypothetical protein